MEETTTIRKELTLFIIGFVAFFAAIGYAGKADYQEAVIRSINYEAYDQIVEKVGNDADDIIREYRMHQEYYDSLSY